MNETQALEKHIHESLAPIFEQQGYELCESGRQYRLLTPGGYRSIQFALASSHQQQFIQLHLGIRNNMIEELVSQFVDDFWESEQQELTIVASYAHLSQHPSRYFLIKDARSLEEVCQRMVGFMQRKGFNFLSKLDNLRHIDALINRKPEQFCPYFRNQTIRCFKATTIAKFIHRANFNHVVKTYLNYLNKQVAHPDIIDNYKTMVKFLKYFSVN